jgi:hypothetical protein
MLNTTDTKGNLIARRERLIKLSLKKDFLQIRALMLWRKIRSVRWGNPNDSFRQKTATRIFPLPTGPIPVRWVAKGVPTTLNFVRRQLLP